MKLEAIKHQGKLRDSVSRSADVVGGATGDSGRTVQRYVRLTYLDPKILQLVDDGAISLDKGIELSRLPEDEQWGALRQMTRSAPSKPPKPPTTQKPFKVSYERAGRFFKPDDEPQYIEETIERALEAYFRNGGDAE